MCVKSAYVKGLSIENSFSPKVGEINELFETEYEKLFHNKQMRLIEAT